MLLQSTAIRLATLSRKVGSFNLLDTKIGINIHAKEISLLILSRYCHNTLQKKKMAGPLKGQLKTMKLSSSLFHQIFTPELEILNGIFQRYNYEVRIAGGAVRDLLMEKLPHDIDFATTATPEEMVEMFTKENIRMINDNGIKHGTITARINEKENFEVTTLRIDVVTDGRRALVEYTKDWQQDANRRDLTINAMFLDMNGIIYDYFGGIEDVANRKVRFVGEAKDRIQEDYLRILRYFRFFGRVAVTPDDHEPGTLETIEKYCNGLSGISGERLWMELQQIVKGRFNKFIVPQMLKVGLGTYLGIPVDANISRYSQICQQLEGLEPNHMTLLSGLFETEEQVYEFHRRVKLSNDELHLMVFLVNQGSVDIEDDHVKYYKDLICDSEVMESKMITRMKELLMFKNEMELLRTIENWKPPKFPVGGKDLLEKNVPKGPVFNRTLKRLRNIWKESNFTLGNSELVFYIDKILESVKEDVENEKKNRKSESKKTKEKNKK